MDNLKAVVLAIIEGITEFLPVSSTGHMAIASAFLDIESDPFTKLFEVVIQFGAILSVVVLYWRKFIDFKKFSFYAKLLVAILPALAFGALFKKHIDNMLEKPLFISLVLLGGGVLLLFVDRWFKNGSVKEEEEISYKKGFIIGLYQVLAVILPGLSRSAATIVGGMQQKLTRSLAAEFSFFLAVPTMFAATAKSLLDIVQEQPEVLNTEGIQYLLLGSAVAFVVALLAIRFFIRFLQQNGFKAFGWYRIALGTVLIMLILLDKL
ncbi:MAG: undecaprenyl-diphosphate phosphatase [Chitinophagia bacterium]|jgi:undecaprenyl-diphosphatase|nr:undecaprenyl-diphosphate phosphatase [Chitinophagia bacterium]